VDENKGSRFAAICKESEFFAPAVHRLNIADTESAADRAVVEGRCDQYLAIGINDSGQGEESAVNGVIMDNYTS
jgi:hypothetical protein